MNVPTTDLNRRAIPRAVFGRVTVFFGEKNGKYPDANQVIVRGSDTQAAFDTPVVANHIGPEFDRTDIVILGHVHEDHMAAERQMSDGDDGDEPPPDLAIASELNGSSPFALAG